MAIDIEKSKITLEKTLSILNNIPKSQWSFKENAHPDSNEFGFATTKYKSFGLKSSYVNVSVTHEKHIYISEGLFLKTEDRKPQIYERYHLKINRDNSNYPMGFFARIFTDVPKTLPILDVTEEKRKIVGQLEQFFKKINDSYNPSVGNGLRSYIKNVDLLESLQKELFT